jgi:hypothetical protein
LHFTPIRVKQYSNTNNNNTIQHFLQKKESDRQNLYVSLVITIICLYPCWWSLMSLIIGNKVKNTHKPRYCEKEKHKVNKRILRSLSSSLTTMLWSSLTGKYIYMILAWKHYPCYYVQALVVLEGNRSRRPQFYLPKRHVKLKKKLLKWWYHVWCLVIQDLSSKFIYWSGVSSLADFTCTSIWQETEWRWRRVEWWSRGWGEWTGGVPNRDSYFFLYKQILVLWVPHIIKWLHSS